MVKNESICIYSMKLAGFLMLKGFVCFQIGDNKKYNSFKYNKKVYFFKYSDELQSNIEYFQSNKKKILEFIMQ